MKTAQSIGEQAGVKVVPVYAVAEKAGLAIADGRPRSASMNFISVRPGTPRSPT
jgi:hypothetical protein